MDRCPHCHQVIYPEPHDPDTRQSWAALEEKLLGIAGHQVIWQREEPFLAELLARGQLFPGQITQQRGVDPAGQQDAARPGNQDAIPKRTCTGYGLYNGVWRPHSWTCRDDTILEASVRPERYLGVPRNELEALRFWRTRFCARRAEFESKRALQKLVQRFPQAPPVVKPAGSLPDEARPPTDDLPQ